MSLINQMLRDLEARRPAAAGNLASAVLAADRAGTPPAAPAPRGQAWLIAGLALMTILLTLLLVMQGEGEDAVAASHRPVVQPPMPTQSTPRHPAPGTQTSTRSPQPSALGTQPPARSTHPPAPSTPSPVPGPQSSAPGTQHPALSTPPAARLKTIRLRHLDGLTRLFVDLDRRVEHHTALDGERLTLTLSGITGSLPVLPALAGTPLADLDAVRAGDELRLMLRFDTPQTLRGSELRETADGVRLVLSLVAAAPAPGGEAREAVVVDKRIRPLDAGQRAEQALRRGLGLLGEGRRAEAELALREALRLDPGRARAREALAALYLNAGRLAEAGDLLDDGLRLDPRDSGLARLQARLMARRGEPGAALAVLQRAAPPLADDPEYHALMAALFQRAGRHRTAAWTYRQLLQRQPGQAAWWMGLGISLEALEDRPAALDAYLRAHQLGAGLSAQVIDYLGGRIRALAPQVAALREAGGDRTIDGE